MSKMAEYLIEAKTVKGKIKSSTDASIYIKMVGQSASISTEWTLLDNWFRDDFEEGRWDTFKIKTKEIGLPKAIGLKIEKKYSSDGWFCERVIVKSKELNKTVEFLVLDWLLTELWVVAGEETLPQKETCPFIKDVRTREVERNRVTYQWIPRPCPGELGWSLPRFCNETMEQIPFMFESSDNQVFSFEGTRSLIKKDIFKEYLSGKIGFGTELNDYDDYMELFNGTNIPVDKPKFYSKWQEDEEFGRSILNGTNPITVQKISQIPDGVMIKAEQLDGLLDDDINFEQALERNRIYVSDHRQKVRGLPRNIRTKSRAQMHGATPIAMLYVTNKGAFTPILIQLEEDDPDYVFTPNDSAEDWQLAKMYFKSADIAVHQWISHFLYTHAVMEPFAVGLFRNISSRHPIYKLMKPHLRTVAAINTIARKDLLPPTSISNQCIGMNAVGTAMNAFESLRYDNLNLPNFLEDNGIKDSEALPNYHYRDDALELWEVINKYVGRVITIYYQTDEDVVTDTELQNWVKDVAYEGIGWQDGDTKGFPTCLHTVEELQSYLTVVVYTCSVQHAAINFGQFESYKVMPNTPGAMRLPSHKRGEATKQRILDSLPDAVMTLMLLGVTFLLSRYSAEDVFLGQYTEELFANGGVWLAKERFRRDLKKVEERIIERNEGLEIPYTTLLPSKIPNSIAS